MNIHSSTTRIHDIDDAVPPALLRYQGCAPWRAQPIAGKETKAKKPFNPNTGRPAKPNSPSTFGSWAEAKAQLPMLLADFGQHPEGGMGVLLGVGQSDGTTIGGIDLDTCYVNGTLSPWATEIIGLFRGYTEASPSGGGAHVLFRYKTSERDRLKAAAEGKSVLWRGAGSNGVGHSPGIELYLDLRFFTVSGNRIGKSRELPVVSAATVARLSGIAAKLPRATSAGKRANDGTPDRSAMATSLLIKLLLANPSLTFDEGMAALANAGDPLIMEWFDEQDNGSKAGDRQRFCQLSRLLVRRHAVEPG